MKFLFLFMDGVGLGEDDPEINPFTKASMPNLRSLLGERNLVASSAPFNGDLASLKAIDANLEVEGLPQSATGQAALLTGNNVQKIIGGHYGPKPNPPVAKVIKEGTLFSKLIDRGYSIALLNSYPQAYFDNIESGRRIYSAIPMAITAAGVKLKTSTDLQNRDAITADFTGEGWNSYFKDDQSTVMSPTEAGIYLANLAMKYDLGFFEYWPSDYAGHKQDENRAVELLETFDGVLGGLVEAWDHENGLILITSDHGNMEDLSTRRHTANNVPALVIGNESLRIKFLDHVDTIKDVTPAILQFYS